MKAPRALFLFLLMASAGACSSAGLPVADGAAEHDGSAIDGPVDADATGPADLAGPADAPRPADAGGSGQDAGAMGLDAHDANPGDGAVASICPPLSSPCTDNTGCSQGDPVDLRCRHFQICRSGSWNQPFFYDCGAGANVCPAAHPQNSAPCTSSARICSYPTGTCACVTGCESGADAGACRMPLHWECLPPPAAPCPAQAPQWGAGCATDGARCRYSSGCVNYEVRCAGGTWQPADPVTLGICS